MSNMFDLQAPSLDSKATTKTENIAEMKNVLSSFCSSWFICCIGANKSLGRDWSAWEIELGSLSDICNLSKGPRMKDRLTKLCLLYSIQICKNTSR